MNKPICKYCKYRRTSGFTGRLGCFEGRQMDELGNWSYPTCSFKNKDFKCTDFKPKLIYRRKYK